MKNNTEEEIEENQKEKQQFSQPQPVFRGRGNPNEIGNKATETKQETDKTVSKTHPSKQAKFVKKTPTQKDSKQVKKPEKKVKKVTDQESPIINHREPKPKKPLLKYINRAKLHVKAPKVSK